MRPRTSLAEKMYLFRVTQLLETWQKDPLSFYFLGLMDITL